MTTAYEELSGCPLRKGVIHMTTYDDVMLVLAAISTVATVIGVIIAILKNNRSSAKASG